MELIEKIDAEYDKADALSGRCDIPRDTLLGWKNEVVQLKAKLEDEEGLKMQAAQEWNRVEAENERLRKQFEQAAERVKTGRTKKLMFKCSHCQKDTPLLIDALLTTEGPDRS